MTELDPLTVADYKTCLVGECLCGNAWWSLLLFAPALHHHHSRVHVGRLQVNLRLLEHGAIFRVGFHLI